MAHTPTINISLNTCKIFFVNYIIFNNVIYFLSFFCDMFFNNLYLELAIFSFAVFGIVIFDSGMFSKRLKNGANFRFAFAKVGFYLLLAVAFAFLIYIKRGQKDMFLFATSYFLEFSLSIDNVFVFILIFNYFAASNSVRNRVLLYGVILAFFLRGLFIFLGVAIVQKFAFSLLIFGIILVATAAKILYQALNGEEVEEDISNSKLLQFISRAIPINKSYEGAKFYKDGFFTKAFLILLFVSLADVLFAVDSIPAVFAVTQDVYIIYTSNILAILGLRSLFFVIDKFIHLFKYLKHGLGIILLAIGLKLSCEVFFPLQMHHIFPAWSMLVFTFFVFAVSIAASKLAKSH